MRMGNLTAHIIDTTTRKEGVTKFGKAITARKMSRFLRMVRIKVFKGRVREVISPDVDINPSEPSKIKLLWNFNGGSIPVRRHTDGRLDLRVGQLWWQRHGTDMLNVYKFSSPDREFYLAGQFGFHINKVSGEKRVQIFKDDDYWYQRSVTGNKFLLQFYGEDHRTKPEDGLFFVITTDDDHRVHFHLGDYKLANNSGVFSYGH